MMGLVLGVPGGYLSGLVLGVLGLLVNDLDQPFSDFQGRLL